MSKSCPKLVVLPPVEPTRSHQNLSPSADLAIGYINMHQHILPFWTLKSSNSVFSDFKDSPNFSKDCVSLFFTSAGKAAMSSSGSKDFSPSSMLKLNLSDRRSEQLIKHTSYSENNLPLQLVALAIARKKRLGGSMQDTVVVPLR